MKLYIKFVTIKFKKTLFDCSLLIATDLLLSYIKFILLPNNLWVIISRRKRWAGHVACMGENENAYKIWFNKPEGEKRLEYVGVHEMIILILILKK